jgi:putative transposase
MCYVEQNPVRAGIVNHPSEYSFTSYHAHAEDRVDDLVDKEDNPVYMALAKTMPERAVRYQRIVSTLLNEDKLRAIRGSLSGHSHFCSGEFITKVGENILMNRKRRRGRPLKRA